MHTHSTRTAECRGRYACRANRESREQRTHIDHGARARAFAFCAPVYVRVRVRAHARAGVSPCLSYLTTGRAIRHPRGGCASGDGRGIPLHLHTASQLDDDDDDDNNGDDDVATTARALRLIRLLRDRFARATIRVDSGRGRRARATCALWGRACGCIRARSCSGAHTSARSRGRVYVCTRMAYTVTR